jgi:hypothetical protein
MIICRYLEMINLWVLCITIFPEKAQNKIKAGIKTTFLLMMTILKAKIPTQVHIRLGRDERIFFEKQQTINKRII